MSQRLREALGGAELGWVRARMRARLERGRPLTGLVRHARPSAGERDALERLLGRTLGGEGIALRLEELEALLRGAGLADTLAEAVEALSGPVRDRRAERERAAAAWSELFDAAARRAGAPAVAMWLEAIRADGSLKRASEGDPARAAQLLERALRVAARLPAADIALAELAAEACRDSHALDPGRPLGTLCVRLAAAIGRGETTLVDGAEARREAWAGTGVVCDELSAPALVLNLRAAADDGGTAARALALYAGSGEPARLSLRQLRSPPRFVPEGAMRAVSVCENPAVVEAAASALGAGCRPLVCTEGQPRTAVRVLLGALARAGVELRFHADFDWAGLTIGNLLARRHGARPWRMSADDYRAVAGEVPLRGESVEADWDGRLADAMRAAGCAVHEEQMLPQLLADLG